MKKLLTALALVLSLAGVASAQTLTSKTISTAGADCSVATRCVVVDVKQMTSVGVNLDVGTSGTFQFEASMDATNQFNGTWFSITDDVGAGSNATADGRFFFSNPGYRFIRIRASAISGNATVTITEGFTGLRSTATLSGASQGDGAILDGTNPLLKATVIDLANSNPVASAIVDASGNQITSFGGGTQYTEDVAAAADPIGTMNIARRKDTLSAGEVSADGDNIALNATAKGELYVKQTDVVPISAASLPLPALASTSTKQSDGSQKTQIVDGSGNVIASTSNNLNVQCANCSGSGASAADQATMTEGSSTFAPAGGEFRTTPGTLTTGQQGMVALTSKRAFQVSLFDASGTALLGQKTTAGSIPIALASDATLPVTNAGTFAVQAAGTKTNNNAAPGATNVGSLGALANAATPTWTEGNLVALSVDLKGLLRTTSLDSGGTSTTDTTAHALKMLAVDASGAAITPTTLATHDGALTAASTTGGTPLLRASAAAPTGVSADDDAVLPWALRNGSQVVNIASGGNLIGATSNALDVNIKSGASSGTQYTQDAALTVSTSVGTMAIGRASAAAPTNVSADDDAVMPWYLRSGAQAIQPTFGGVLSSTGTGAVGTGTARVAVGTDSATIAGSAPGIAGTASTNVITVQGIASGTSLGVTCSNCTGTGVSVNEDVASANGDPGTPAYAVRQDTISNLTSADGDYAPLKVNSVGRVYTSTTIDAAIPAGANVIGALTANQSTNTAQVNGVTTLTGTGATGTGSQRVTVAVDSATVAGSASLPTGANVIGSLTANQSVNVAQINGVTPLMGAGNTGTGSQRVTIATDQAALPGMGVGTTGSAPPTNGSYIVGNTSGATGGLVSGGVPVCDQQAFLNMTTATTTEIVPLTSGRTVHICHARAMAGGTTTLTFKRGTGTNCGTGTAAIDADYELTAQTGFSAGSGFGEILSGVTAANAVCVTSSAAVNLHVFVRYAVY